MKKPKHSIKKTLLTGLAIIVPLYLTFLIIRFVFNVLADPLSPAVTILFQKINIQVTYLPWVINIIAVFLTLLLFYIVGLLGKYFITKKLLLAVESILFSIPMVQPIYHTMKKMVSLLTDSGEHIYEKVVSVPFLDGKMQVIGFITGSKLLNNEEYLSIFVPTSPNPTSGYLLFVKPSAVKELDISIENALKLVVSVGIMDADKEMASNKKPIDHST